MRVNKSIILACQGREKRSRVFSEAAFRVAGVGSYIDPQFHNHDFRVKTDVLKKYDFIFGESEDDVFSEMGQQFINIKVTICYK